MNNFQRQFITIGSNALAETQINANVLHIKTIQYPNLTIIPESFSITLSSAGVFDTITLTPFQLFPNDQLPTYLSYDQGRYSTIQPFSIIFPSKYVDVVMDIFGIVIPASCVSGQTITYSIQNNSAFIFRVDQSRNLYIRSKSNVVDRVDILTQDTNLSYPNGFNGLIEIYYATIRGTPLYSDSPLVFLVSTSN